MLKASSWKQISPGPVAGREMTSSAVPRALAGPFFGVSFGPNISATNEQPLVRSNGPTCMAALIVPIAVGAIVATFVAAGTNTFVAADAAPVVPPHVAVPGGRGTPAGP